MNVVGALSESNYPVPTRLINRDVRVRNTFLELAVAISTITFLCSRNMTPRAFRLHASKFVSHLSEFPRSIDSKSSSQHGHWLLRGCTDLSDFSAWLKRAPSLVQPIDLRRGRSHLITMINSINSSFAPVAVLLPSLLRNTVSSCLTANLGLQINKFICLSQPPARFLFTTRRTYVSLSRCR